MYVSHVLILLSPQDGPRLVSQMPHFITCLSHRSYLKGLLTFFSTLTGENDVNTVCAGKEYRLPVYSTSRMVTFTPNFKGTRHVLLNKTTVSQSVSLLVLLFLCLLCRFLNDICCTTVGNRPTV